MATVSRNGMTTTISGLTRSGKIGAVETKATNTGIDVGRAIAEAPRRGTSRLVDLSSSEAGKFPFNVRCRTAEAVAFFGFNSIRRLASFLHAWVSDSTIISNTSVLSRNFCQLSQVHKSFINALKTCNLKQAFGTHLILAMIPSCIAHGW